MPWLKAYPFFKFRAYPLYGIITVVNFICSGLSVIEVANDCELSGLGLLYFSNEVYYMYYIDQFIMIVEES